MKSAFPAPIEHDGEPAVSARDLYLNVLEQRAGDFGRWLKRTILNSADFVEGEDYQVFRMDAENPRGGRPGKDVALKLRAAREICLMSSTERGRAYRRHLLRLEDEHVQAELKRREEEGILRRLIATEPMPWERAFPPSYYMALSKITGIKWRGGPPKPAYWAALTNELVYRRLPAGVLERLQNDLNPADDGGKRKFLHQQYFQGEGRRILLGLIREVTILMRGCDSVADARRVIGRALPINGRVQLDLVSHFDDLTEEDPESALIGEGL